MKITTPQDFFANSGVGGPQVVNGQIVNNASTLRHEEHKRYDSALIQVARERLNGIADLRSRGLTVNLGGIGVILSMYERVGEMIPASISMDGIRKGDNDRLTFDEVGVPIPVFHQDWSLNERQLVASRTVGQGLDTTQTQFATRSVIDSMEDALFVGVPSLVVDGKQIYGYTNHPDRETGTISNSWATTTGGNIIADTKAMLQKAYANNFFGPFVMYVSKDFWANIQDDYSSTKGDNTIKDRIEAFVDITEVKPADRLPNGTAVLVQLTSDVVDLAIAQDIRNLQWSKQPMQTNYKVFSILAPRVKSNRDSKTGIVHYSV